MKRVIVILALVAAPAYGADVYLRGGGQITGVIVEQTDESVTVDIGGATISARMSSVVRIDESVSPLEMYRERAAGIPEGDADAWRELARWARGRALSSQSLEAFTKVLEVLPDDKEANEALGRIRVGEQWITEDEYYRNQGYIPFEGQWMRPSEKQAIQNERTAQERAAQQANEARIREIEAEQQAEKERIEKQREQEKMYRNPVSWGWGYGPRYWPDPVRRWP